MVHLPRSEVFMKKGFAILSILLAGCFAAGCAGSPENGKDKFDVTKLPYYEEDAMEKEYSYTDAQRIQPYWLGNIIYNEQLMVVEKDGETEGHLLYDAARVISVRNWSLEHEFAEGTDYVVEGNRITLPEGSTIPVFRDKWARGQEVPSEYQPGNAATGYQMIGDMLYTESGLIYKNYIHVTYVYDPSKVERAEVTKYSGALYGLTQALEEKRNIKMVVFGDSISEGCSSSGKWGRAPFCPSYAELVKGGIETLGGVSVTLENLSVGGKDSSWGADEDQLAALSKTQADLLVLGFGTNDGASNIEGNRYRNNIEKMIAAARTGNPECQIILLAPFPSNAESKSAAMHEKLNKTLRGIAESGDYLDVCCVSLYESCLGMLKVKNYYEIAANNVNHPNDFVTRCYAMNILSAIFELE